MSSAASVSDYASSATIKTLRIDGRRATQTIFRQLDELSLHDSITTSHGSAWGRINYHPDNCRNEREHLHLLWQQESGVLARARLDAPPISNGWLGLQAMIDYRDLISRDKKKDAEAAVCLADHGMAYGIHTGPEPSVAC